jgi:hypothetical protein
MGDVGVVCILLLLPIYAIISPRSQLLTLIIVRCLISCPDLGRLDYTLGTCSNQIVGQIKWRIIHVPCMKMTYNCMVV